MNPKAALRQEIRTALAALTPDDRAAASQRALAQLEQSARWRRARCVLLYAPLPFEPALDRFWAGKEATAGERMVCYPRVHGSELEVRQVTALAELIPGRFGLREPDPARTPVVDPSTLDLVLVPGLAFTAAGARLGRGGGYYDRFLAGLAPHISRVALAFTCQMRATLPEDPHDVRMHEVIVG